MAVTDTSELRSDLEFILTEVAKTKNIKEYEIVPNLNASGGDGFISHIYTGEVKNKDTGEIINVVIKKASEWQLDYGPICKNEELFYSSVFPALDSLQKSYGVSEPFDNLPVFFCAGSERKKQFIALENLKTLGYIMFDKNKYLDREHLEYIFKIYGKFHAVSFVLKKQNRDQYEKIQSELTDTHQAIVDVFINIFKTATAAALDALDHNSHVFKALKDLPENIRETFVHAAKYTGNYGCITHGDCWSNNMLFKYADSGKLEDIKLLDFQLTAVGTPIRDISYFFYSGACKTDIDNLEYYLKLYHDSLLAFMKQLGESSDELLPFDVLRKEWKQNALFGVIMGIVLWPVKLAPKEELTEVMTDTEHTVEEIGQKFERIMENVYKSDAYRERTSAILIHAFDYGIINKDRIIIKKEENNATEKK